MALDGDVHTGTRIRERRIDLGIRQADLAKALAISPSYLNLIEHNRRRIAGALLVKVGQVLEVEPALLMRGADRAVMEQLYAAAAGSETQPELDRTEELAARYPGWTAVIADQQSRIVALESRVEELSDRMTHDPELATSLHAVISAATSIRSTASILTSDEKLDADWLKRFHNNIHADALKLAGSSDALVRYLDAPADQDVPLSPFEEVSQFFQTSHYHFAGLENATVTPDEAARSAELSPLATQILIDALTDYRRRARAMPVTRMRKVIREVGFDPFALSAAFSMPLADTMHRLASLPPEDGQPAIGLAACDGSGALTFLKAITGFSMPYAGAACPLWPLFTALGQSDRPLRAEVALPGQQDDRFLCYAIASQSAGTLTTPPVIKSTMLVVADPDIDPEITLPVGPTCRICPRADCSARREPSALSSHL